MLLLNVTYTMKPGMRDTFLKEVQAQGILDAVRQEDGCLQYAYYLPAQEDNTLLLVERWRDRAAQQVHLTTPPYGRPGQDQGGLRGGDPDRIRHRRGVTPLLRREYL